MTLCTCDAGDGKHLSWCLRAEEEGAGVEGQYADLAVLDELFLTTSLDGLTGEQQALVAAAYEFKSHAEAELSRLREGEREAIQSTLYWKGIATAAEAMCARLQQALEAAGREAGRAQDVRVNRTRIIGNIALIVDEALAGTDTPQMRPTPADNRGASSPPASAGPDTPADSHSWNQPLAKLEDGKWVDPFVPADSQEDKT